MTAPLVTVSVARTSLSLAALEFKSIRGAWTWTIIGGLQVPAKVRRNTYMPEHPDIHGNELISSVYQQGVLSWVAEPEAASETALQTAVSELEAAIGQFSFNTTITIGTAPAQVWSCDAGSVSLANSSGRTYVDLRDSSPRYVVTIPVYPIAS